MINKYSKFVKKSLFNKKRLSCQTCSLSFIKSSSKLSGVYLAQPQCPSVCSLYDTNKEICWTFADIWTLSTCASWQEAGLVPINSDASGLLFVLFASSEWLLMLNVQVTQLWRADQVGSGPLPSAAERSQWSCLCVVVNHTLWSWDDVSNCNCPPHVACFHCYSRAGWQLRSGLLWSWMWKRFSGAVHALELGNKILLQNCIVNYM